ncbi:hypothetical protein QTH90_01785 [Variovorax sp. J2P1-59]|uniref:hypothetical protein n=1 Tax=Variovorax flavidus TaxID=3053501 RepID=UPI0025752641|nr:hypothetical protein [Variovorax sp. J2P1-59]MDM0073093.1 hypothetical protein [Variovorax sp. J2P1-59]
MELASSAWHVFGAAIVFIVGLGLAARFARIFKVRAGWAVTIYLWHSIFSIIYSMYVIEFGGDALMYFDSNLVANAEFAFGTSGIQYFTYFLSQYLGLSFLGACLVFGVLGAVGLIAFHGSMQCIVVGKSVAMRRAATVAIFLPSVSFWSSGIGKDSVAFLAANLALWAALDLNRRTRAMVIAGLFMLFVRPHVAGIMIISLAASIISSRTASLKRRIFVGTSIFTVAAFLIPFALKYSGVAEAASFLEFVEERQSYNLEGGSSIDISEMMLPVQLFTYLFRPLPFEANGLASMLVSFENVALLLLSILGAWKLMTSRGRTLEEGRVFLWTYCIFSWFMLATTTANLGIAVRQKWMFTPVLVLLLFSVIGKRALKGREVVDVANFNMHHSARNDRNYSKKSAPLSRSLLRD